MTKKIVTDKKDLEIQLDVCLDGITLEDFAYAISTLILEYGKDAYIDKEYYGYDGGYDLYLYYERYETDKEYKKRLSDEDKQKKKKERERELKEEKEHKEYLRLKKKFGE